MFESLAKTVIGEFEFNHCGTRGGRKETRMCGASGDSTRTGVVDRGWAASGEEGACVREGLSVDLWLGQCEREAVGKV